MAGIDISFPFQKKKNKVIEAGQIPEKVQEEILELIKSASGFRKVSRTGYHGGDQGFIRIELGTEDSEERFYSIVVSNKDHLEFMGYRENQMIEYFLTCDDINFLFERLYELAKEL